MTDFKRWLVLLAVMAAGWLVYCLQPILMPFLLGALFAYLGNPIVVRLTRLGLRRTWAVTLAFSTLLAITVMTLVLTLPTLWRQLMFLQSKLPGLLRWINATGIPWMETHFHIRIDRLDMAFITQWVSSYWGDASRVIGKELLPRMAQSGLQVAGFVAMLALVPVVTFYLLLDWEELLASTRRLIPRPLEATVVRLTRECDQVLAAFFRGQLLVMLILGVVYSVGLEIIGLHLGLIIGMVAGLGSIIPYFGFGIGILSATIVCLFQHGPVLSDLVAVWVVFGVGQIIEGWVLQPFFLGDRIGLPPVAVIFSVMAGGTLFGFFGMLVALPMAAVIMVLLRELHRRYLDSALYRQWPGPAPSVDDPDADS